MYTILLSNDLTPFTAFDFFSPLSTVSIFVSFEQKIECSPLLVTNVKKEIQLKYCQKHGCISINRQLTSPTENNFAGKRSMECKQNKDV